MMTVDLCDILEDLKDDEFQKFIWYLQQPGFMKPYQAIKESKLEKANILKTVDLMVKTFELHGALEVTRKVLQKIPRNDLLQRLPNTSSGPEGPRAEIQQRNVSAEDRVPADQKLFSVRTQFINRVSDPVLNQLLDKLLERRVITDAEMQSFRTKHRADKARDVIDTVKRKGSEACSVLITALREVDPYLYTALNFS